MHELAPGKYQSRHRHGGEAWLYVHLGHRLQRHRRRAPRLGGGRPIVVDHWAWHQHFNGDSGSTARLVRIHNFDASTT